MSDIDTLRRFYCLKRMDAARQGDCALSSTWQAMQEAQPGAPFPTGFPCKTALEAAGYESAEDVKGADVDELSEYALLSQRDAEAVIAAAAAL